jgi:uncharacterized protein (UPF0276 family)
MVCQDIRRGAQVIKNQLVIENVGEKIVNV